MVKEHLSIQRRSFGKLDKDKGQTIYFWSAPYFASGYVNAIHPTTVFDGLLLPHELDFKNWHEVKYVIFSSNLP